LRERRPGARGRPFDAGARASLKVEEVFFEIGARPRLIEIKQGIEG
jgi:hypothetical protein